MPESKHTPRSVTRGGYDSTRREPWLHWAVVNDRLALWHGAAQSEHGERMATDTSIPDNPFTDEPAGDDDGISSLSRAIQEHLDLKQRNAELDSAMPLDRYSVEDPFENHPLFKSEEQARLEETLDGVEAPEPAPALPWPGEDDTAEGAALDEGLWGRSRDFDWGD